MSLRRDYAELLGRTTLVPSREWIARVAARIEKENPRESETIANCQWKGVNLDDGLPSEDCYQVTWGTAVETGGYRVTDEEMHYLPVQGRKSKSK